MVRRYPRGTPVTNEICRISLITQELAQLETADRVLADAAEIQVVIVFDDIGDLSVAVGRSVLQVLNDAALRVERDNEGITLRSGLHSFR